MKVPALLVTTVACASLIACAQNAPSAGVAAAPAAPASAPPSVKTFSFFITSEGPGKGADLGGLDGADAHCAKLAADVGATHTRWHAYLSTQATDGRPAINARDRIGNGPWTNTRGAVVARDLAHLHGDTLELARLGNNLSWATAFNEKNE